MAIEDDSKEAFLSRWSRLKREQEASEAAPPARTDDEEPAPALPPTDKLTPESDFAPFMHPKVADALRRVALKKLFADPHFNVPDLNEAFSGDWTGGEPISQELLAKLNQARSVLFREDEAKDKDKAKPAEPEPVAARDSEVDKDPDGPERKDA